MLTIGQLSERSGVATSAIRFYESRGLVESARTTGNQRRYDQADAAPGRVHPRRPAGRAHPRRDRRGARHPARRAARPPRRTGPGSARRGGPARRADPGGSSSCATSSTAASAAAASASRSAGCATPTTRSPTAGPGRSSSTRGRPVAGTRPRGRDTGRMALHFVATPARPGARLPALGHPARGVGRPVPRARSPAASRATSSGSSAPAPRHDVRRQGDARPRWRTGSTACSATSAASACRSVVPQCVVTGRETPDGEPLPAMLVTRHLQFSLPYRWLFSHGLDAAEAAVADRRAGGAAGPAAPGELLLGRRVAVQRAVPAQRRRLRGVPRRRRDRRAAVDAVRPDAASTTSRSRPRTSSPSCSTCWPATTCDDEVDPHDVIERLEERYDALWAELTQEEEFGSGEMWRDRAADRAAQRPRLRRRRDRDRDSTSTATGCCCSPRSSSSATTRASCSR